MVNTPWGNSEELRDRRLRPGPGTPPEKVAENQRERLFAAMVSSVSDRGYAATRVSDLAELSGVSTRSFYALFPDMSACFVATIEALLEVVLSSWPRETDEDWEQRLRSGAEALAELVVSQPAAARVCLVEAYSAGADALRPVEAATARFEALARGAIAESAERAEMPGAMISAYVGALLEIVRARLRHGNEAEMTTLIDDFATVALSFRPPPQPLRLASRPPAPGPERLDAHDHAERALRAFAMVVAEEGYADTTIDQVLKRASMSATTFYSNFENKEDALLAAIDSAGAQLVAAISPPFRRNPDWPNGVRAAFGAFFSYLASRPAMARLVMVEAYAGGATAVERRALALRPVEMLLIEGRRRHRPQLPAIETEAIVGGIYSLTYDHIRENGPESLPSLAPIATYLALAPVIGPEKAAAAANGDGRVRESRSAEESFRGAASLTMEQPVMRLLFRDSAGLREIAAGLGVSIERAEEEMRRFVEAGVVEMFEEPGEDGAVEPTYRTMLSLLETREWALLSVAERRRVSAEIGRLIMADVARAADEGTFDARLDRHLTRIPMVVDEEGWREFVELHDASLHAALQIEERSRERLRASGDAGIHARSIQAMFEVPPD